MVFSGKLATTIHHENGVSTATKSSGITKIEHTLYTESSSQATVLKSRTGLPKKKKSHLVDDTLTQGGRSWLQLSQSAKMSLYGDRNQSRSTPTVRSNKTPKNMSRDLKTTRSLPIKGKVKYEMTKQSSSASGSINSDVAIGSSRNPSTSLIRNHKIIDKVKNQKERTDYDYNLTPKSTSPCSPQWSDVGHVKSNGKEKKSADAKAESTNITLPTDISGVAINDQHTTSTYKNDSKENLRDRSTNIFREYFDCFFQSLEEHHPNVFRHNFHGVGEESLEKYLDRTKNTGNRNRCKIDDVPELHTVNKDEGTLSNIEVDKSVYLPNFCNFMSCGEIKCFGQSKHTCATKVIGILDEKRDVEDSVIPQSNESNSRETSLMEQHGDVDKCKNQGNKLTLDSNCSSSKLATVKHFLSKSKMSLITDEEASDTFSNEDDQYSAIVSSCDSGNIGKYTDEFASSNFKTESPTSSERSDVNSLILKSDGLNFLKSNELERDHTIIEKDLGKISTECTLGKSSYVKKLFSRGKKGSKKIGDSKDNPDSNTETHNSASNVVPHNKQLNETHLEKLNTEESKPTHGFIEQNTRDKNQEVSKISEGEEDKSLDLPTAGTKERVVDSGMTEEKNTTIGMQNPNNGAQPLTNLLSIFYQKAGMSKIEEEEEDNEEGEGLQMSQVNLDSRSEKCPDSDNHTKSEGVSEVNAEFCKASSHDNSPDGTTKEDFDNETRASQARSLMTNSSGSRSLESDYSLGKSNVPLPVADNKNKNKMFPGKIGGLGLRSIWKKSKDAVKSLPKMNPVPEDIESTDYETLYTYDDFSLPQFEATSFEFSHVSTDVSYLYSTVTPARTSSLSTEKESVITETSFTSCEKDSVASSCHTGTSTAMSSFKPHPRNRSHNTSSTWSFNKKLSYSSSHSGGSGQGSSCRSEEDNSLQLNGRDRSFMTTDSESLTTNEHSYLFQKDKSFVSNTSEDETIDRALDKRRRINSLLTQSTRDDVDSTSYYNYSFEFDEHY